MISNIDEDDNFLCDLMILHCLDSNRMVIMMSANKKRQIQLRAQFHNALSNIPTNWLTLAEFNKEYIAFANNSIIVFTTPFRDADCGISPTLIIINNSKIIKNLDEIKYALFPTIAPGEGDIVYCR